jgi:D-lyxose ketol-isomerase
MPRGAWPRLGAAAEGLRAAALRDIVAAEAGMRRSEVNMRIARAEAFLASMSFLLPPWSSRRPEDWRGRLPAESEIVDAMLGWDLTDFGSGDFDRRGLILFTLRNGGPDPRRKAYAEKVMIVGEGQETPTHFHWAKAEDIIARGGGRLVLQLWASTADEGLSPEPLRVSVDGARREVEAGGLVILAPGESICLERGVYHRFFGEAGSGPVLAGEVSSVNDDRTDNRFLEPVGRFPAIEEDEPPARLLASDYPNYVD